MLVVLERVGRLFAQIVGYAADGQIHLGQFIGGVGVFLSIDRNVALVAVVCLNELHALHKHATRTATGVVDFSLVGLYHFGNEVDNRFRGVVLSLTLTFGNGKFGKKVFIDPSDEVVLWVLQGVNLVDFVEEGGQLGAVESQTGIVVAGKCPLQCGIVLLHRGECLVYLDGNVVLLGILHDVVPSACLVQIEHIFGIVKHRLVGKCLLSLGYQLIAPLRKTVVSVFQEYEAQHHMFVFRRFH